MVRNYKRKTELVDIDRMSAAMLAVKRNNMKVAIAAKKFEVCRSTLQKWLKNINEERTEAIGVVPLTHGQHAVSFIIIIFRIS